MEENIYNQPLQSHLITFNPYKIAVFEGYIERVSGMLLSQHLDSDGKVITNRTILTREEMIPDTNIKSDDNDNFNGIYFFNTFPILTFKDVAEVIRSTKGNRLLYESFNDLTRLGCIIPPFLEPLVIKVHEHEKEYELINKELYSIDLNKEWIPTSLQPLYSIQLFLKRRIVLEPYNDTSINTDVINTMNQILENQYKYRIFFYVPGGDGGMACNDGVNTYYENGVTTAMTREEFISKYPDSREILG